MVKKSRLVIVTNYNPPFCLWSFTLILNMQYLLFYYNSLANHFLMPLFPISITLPHYCTSDVFFHVLVTLMPCQVPPLLYTWKLDQIPSRLVYII